jgi:asparagine N-glycosylation enzyme membrane subunit Stt3
MESGAPNIVACVFFLIFGLIGLAFFAFWLWMLIDAVKTTPSADNQRLIWILVVVFLGVIGAAVYYFVQRPKNQALMMEAPPSEPPPPPPTT